MEFQCAVMCRLCLSKNDCFFSIFLVNKKCGYIPAIVISELLAVQVSETDGYPHVICLPCLDKLTDYKSFKEQCLAARSNFDKSFNSSSLLQGTVRVLPI
ncbi:hypothetical protein J437_LFUL017452 [Ladona fulva]|uniref:ZAD domain-containing protein n=1 Tax=Ladona fulva TaxID=123851 RepID=A0A8K0KPA6_LADFU|nr:hypothetical protein J437_LFUL017452 [Ladona fulva]